MSVSPFPFLSLPAEVRMMVYSYVVLPRQEQLVARKENQRFFFNMWRQIKGRVPHTRAFELYFENRETCHQTAKSLRLVSNLIHREITPLFYRNKTLVVCKPNGPLKPRYFSQQDTCHPPSVFCTKFLERLRWTPLEYIRHIEISVTDPDWCLQQSQPLNFPRLETLTIKFWDPRWPILNNAVLDMYRLPNLTLSFMDMTRTLDLTTEEWRQYGKFTDGWTIPDDPFKGLVVEDATRFFDKSRVNAASFLDPQTSHCSTTISESSSRVGWYGRSPYIVASVSYRRNSTMSSPPPHQERQQHGLHTMTPTHTRKRKAETMEDEPHSGSGPIQRNPSRLII